MISKGGYKNYKIKISYSIIRPITLFIMKAVVRYTDASKGCELIEGVPIKSPPAEHVQIKVMASPVNPCDEYFCSGKYTPHGKGEPFACGYEGSGIVTEIGPGVPKEYLNRHVAFYRALKYTEESFGVWTQFAVLHYSACIFLDKDLPFEDTCGMLINPLTIFGFLEIIKKEGHKTITNTAAASALGKILIGICKKEGVELICIVRRDEQITALQNLGAKYVLNQNDPKFEESFKKLATQLNCRIAFDAVGGDLTAKLFIAMPSKSTVYMYGQLGGDYKGLHPCHFMTGDKTLKGFVLSSAEVYKDKAKFQEAASYMLEDLKKGGSMFKTIVAKKYKLSEFKNALLEYKSYATEGKAVIYPNI